MDNNVKQKKLLGIEATMKALFFSDLLQEMISRNGLTTLANAVGMDAGSLSKFKNGEGNISMKNLESLIEYGDVVLITRDRYRRMIEVPITMIELLKDSLGLR